MTTQLTAFLVSFIAIFLRGFQQKNVIHSKYTMIAITSYLLAFGDVVSWNDLEGRTKEDVLDLFDRAIASL